MLGTFPLMEKIRMPTVTTSSQRSEIEDGDIEQQKKANFLFVVTWAYA